MTLTFTPPEDVIPTEDLLRFCETDIQRDRISAIIEFGNVSHAARVLKVDERGLRRMLAQVKARAAAKGHAPEHGMTETVPDGFTVGRKTTLYKVDPVTGQNVPRLFWQRANADDERRDELRREAIRAFMEEFAPIKVPAFQIPEANRDIIPWIQVGDAHIGMLAHEAESGADFNVEIAVRELCAAFKIVIDEIRPCERLVINDLGDSTHFENTAKRTENGGNQLDGERPRLMIRAVSKVMRFVIDLALTKARVVDVITNQGNHSRFGDFWLNEMLEVAYADTDRVNVIDNESVFTGYRMGNTLVMTHHSDKCGPDKLAEVMQSDFQQDFAETTFHYIDIGHIHHKMTAKERNGIVIESWNTLARGDKWHKEKGYRARQSMSVVYRSRTYGERHRSIVPIEMVYDAIRAGHAAEGVPYIPTQRRAFAA